MTPRAETPLTAEGRKLADRLYALNLSDDPDSDWADRAVAEIERAARSTPDPAGAGLRDARHHIEVMFTDEMERGAPTSKLVVEALSRRVLQLIDEALAQSSDGSLDAALRRFWGLATMEGSDGNLWVRRDQVSAAIQGLPIPSDGPRAARLTEHSDAPDDLGAGQ